MGPVGQDRSPSSDGRESRVPTRPSKQDADVHAPDTRMANSSAEAQQQPAAASGGAGGAGVAGCSAPGPSASDARPAASPVLGPGSPATTAVSSPDHRQPLLPAPASRSPDAYIMLFLVALAKFASFTVCRSTMERAALSSVADHRQPRTCSSLVLYVLANC